jgi:hypothetical protein
MSDGEDCSTPPEKLTARRSQAMTIFYEAAKKLAATDLATLQAEGLNTGFPEGEPTFISLFPMCCLGSWAWDSPYADLSLILLLQSPGSRCRLWPPPPPPCHTSLSLPLLSSRVSVGLLSHHPLSAPTVSWTQSLPWFHLVFSAPPVSSNKERCCTRCVSLCRCTLPFSNTSLFCAPEASRCIFDHVYHPHLSVGFAPATA